MNRWASNLKTKLHSQDCVVLLFYAIPTPEARLGMHDCSRSRGGSGLIFATSAARPTPLSLSHRQEVSRLLTRNKRREAGGGEAWSREWEGTAQGEVCNSSKVLLQDQLSVVVWFSFLGLPNKTPQTWGLKQQKFTLSCETGGPKSMCPGTTLPPKAPGGTPCFPRPASRGGWQPGNLCLWPNHTSLCLHYQMDFPSVYLHLALLLLPYKDLALD